MSWRNESRRHALAARGIKTKMDAAANAMNKIDDVKYFMIPRKEKIDLLIKAMNGAAFNDNGIKNETFTAKLMNERMTDNMLNDQVFIRLEKDKTSGKLFDKQLTDPTLPIVFIDSDFAYKHKGNFTMQSQVDHIKGLIKRGRKLDDVPIYDLKSGKIEEGNHRVAALYELGYNSVPVRIAGGWD